MKGHVTRETTDCVSGKKLFPSPTPSPLFYSDSISISSENGGGNRPGSEGGKAAFPALVASRQPPLHYEFSPEMPKIALEVAREKERRERVGRR